MLPAVIAALEELGPFIAEMISDSKVNVSVSSSAISAIEYDFDDGEMTVTFTDGRYFTYSGVPADVFIAFAGSGSPGAYFNSSIRNAY